MLFMIRCITRKLIFIVSDVKKVRISTIRYKDKPTNKK